MAVDQFYYTIPSNRYSSSTSWAPDMLSGAFLVFSALMIKLEHGLNLKPFPVFFPQRKFAVMTIGSDSAHRISGPTPEVS